MDKVISEIADEEKVARILFSPSHVYKGQVSPKAFKVEERSRRLYFCIKI